MRILITGGCGFIGSHIVEALLFSKHNVAVVDNLSTGSLMNLAPYKGSFQFFQCDLLSDDFEKAIQQFKPEIIIHQAAQVSVANSVGNMMFDAQVNILGSIRVIELSKKYDVKKIIYSSSAAVYGHPEHLPIKPDHRIEPLSPYGASKYSVEQYLKIAHSLFQIDYMILRYANVYGPRQNSEGEGGVVSIFANDIIAGRTPVIFGDGLQTRDFIFVEDVAKANLAAMVHGSQKAVNISSGKETSVRQLLSQMGKVTNREVSFRTEDQRLGDIKSSVLCNKDTNKVLQWNPVTSLDSGLEKTLRYYESLRS